MTSRPLLRRHVRWNMASRVMPALFTSTSKPAEIRLDLLDAAAQAS